MDRSRSQYGGQGNVFKGSQLVSSVLERYPSHLKDRKAALQFCRQLFKEGTIRGVFGSDTFEDSVLLYTWNDKHEPQNKPTNKMTSQSYLKSRGGYGISSADTRITKRDLYHQGSIKPVEEQSQTRQVHSYSHLPSDSYFVGHVQVSNTIEQESSPRKPVPHYQSSPNYKRASTASRSSESSVEIASRVHSRNRDKNLHTKPPLGYINTAMTLPHDHDVIPEEVVEEHHVPLMERTGTSTEYDGSSSIPRSCATDVSNYNDIDNSAHQRPWTDYQNSYSDNEKQLIEQMKRMKKEHSHILRTYEDRINKLMNKMHELRNIAQMLENSSTKSSPYGMLQSKPVTYSGSRPDQPDRKPGSYYGSDGEHPPPLPPRPGRGSHVSPNKPLVTPGTKMKTLNWTRIILRDKSNTLKTVHKSQTVDFRPFQFESTDENPTIWHTMQEPTVDAEEVERLFSNPDVSDTDGATLYDDLIIRRGRSRQQLVSIYDSERSKRIVICMKCLRATLTDVVSTVASLDTSPINHEGLAELFEFLSSSTHIEKTLHYVKKKGAGQLDHPEYLVFELSKVDHFTDRLEFMRFRYKTQWHLFEIEQQLRELNTACNELTNSISLKNLLETLLAVGNYLNGNTDFGQADGYVLDVLNRLKETQEKDGKGTLLEFVLKTYCQIYENEVDIGCPTRFRLPEPSNMRHAAQVSFEGIQDALSNLLSDLRSVRDKLLDQKARKDAIRPTDSFRVTAENFFAAALEVIGGQEKVLQDVRDLFLRTARYFQVDNTDVTPQQFFHIFAVFLHDCKYFWKLAHRRLAKERFELEFKFKGQLSAVDLHGYGSFRAGVTEGIHSSILTDPKTSTLTRDEKFNKTQKERTPTVPPKPAYTELRKTGHQADHFDHSPKPLTSTPPSSEKLYKPLPKTPQTVTSLQNGPPTLPSPNYENQSDLNKFYPEQQTHVDSHPEQKRYYPTENETKRFEQIPEAKDNTKDNRNQQFSLKAWLKKEREQVKREIESDTNNENSPGSKKSNTSTRSFTKLKNSMMQRFSGGHSSKREVNSKETKTKDKKPPAFPEPVIERFESGVAADQFASPRSYYQHQNSQFNSPQNMQHNSTQNTPFTSPHNTQITSLQTTQFSPLQTTQLNHQHTPHLSSPESLPFSLKQNTKLNLHQNYQFNSPQGKLFNSPQNRYLNGPDYDYNLSNPDVVISPIDDLEQEEIHDGPLEMANMTPPDPEDLPRYGARDKISEPNQTYKSNTENEHNSIFVRQHNIPTKLSHVSPNVHRNEEKPSNNYENQYPVQQSVGKNQHQERNEDGANNNIADIGESRQLAPTDRDRFLKKNKFDPKDNQHQYDTRSGTSTYGTGEALDNDSQMNKVPNKPARLDNEHFLTPGTREPMHIKSIGSLSDKFSAMNNNEDTDTHLDTISERVDINKKEERHRAFTSKTVKSTTRNDLSDISPPLPPRTYTSNEAVKQSRHETTQSTESEHRNNNLSAYDRLTNLTMTPPGTQFTSPQTHISRFSTPQPYSRQTRSDSNIRPAGKHDPSGARPSKYTSPYLTSSSQSYQQQNVLGDTTRLGDPDQNKYVSPKNPNMVEEKDEGYRAQLRRAANINPSAFTGYGSLKPTLPYTGRASLGPSYQSPTSTAVVKPTVLNNQEVSYMAF